MGKVRVYLLGTHPTGKLLTRLADGSVIETTREGTVIDEELVSHEMRNCMAYQYEKVAGGRKPEEPQDLLAAENAEEKPKPVKPPVKKKPVKKAPAKKPAAKSTGKK